VGWWDEVSAAVQSFLDLHGIVAGFVLILVEETGIPVPVPGDFLMLALGAHARQGRVPLWEAILAMEAATLIGGSILYLVSRKAGRSLVYRYGRYMHLTPERLDRAERWLRERGSVAIVAGRLTPGLRMATVIACGVFGVPFWRFLPGLSIGALLYILLYTMLGFVFGPAVLDVVTGIHLPLGLLGSLVPLVALVVWIVRARQGLHLAKHTEASNVDYRHRWRDGALAGGLATIVSTLTLNVLVNVSGDLALVAPGDLVEHARARLAVFALARVIGPVLLLAALPGFFLVGVAWGAVYAEWVEPHLHYADWLSGIAFALLPLAVALVVVIPLLDAAGPQLAPLGPLAATSETIRHLIFGVTLGLAYPLRLARLPQRVRGRPRSRMPMHAAAASG
jgi:membrane protein DedA with SNARE-associated domain